MWDPREDAWAAGFIDGEGSFILALKRQRRRPSGTYEVIGVQPWMQIGLRADDGDILEQLAAAFGGTVRYYPTRSESRNSRPRYVWVVAAKADLSGLLDYLERFPLRSKKARDLAIWRRAVRVYLARGARDPELQGLREMLSAERTYLPPAAVGRHRLRPLTRRPTLRRPG